VDTASGIAQQLRLYTNEPSVEMINWIGPIDISNGVGREPIVRFNTSVNTGNPAAFWTDSNSYLELQPRFLNFHPNYNITIYEPVSTNYYPVTSLAAIKDNNNFFGYVTDRARGGSSQATGSLEVMLHRRLINDCNEDASYHQMNDSTIVVSTSRFILSSPSTAASQYHPLQLRLSHPVQVYFGTGSPLPTKQYNGLATTLPANLHILTLQTLHTGKVILRLQHLYGINEDAELSKPVTIDITTLFNKFTITAISETSVTANQPLPLNRLTWKTQSFNGEENPEIPAPASTFQVGAPYSVTFQPMQIRTFLLTVTWP